MIRITTIRGYADRVSANVRSRPSLVERLAWGALLLGGLAVAVLVLLPILLIAAVVSGMLMFAGWIARRLARARQPNGVLDGRKNVRVIPPDQAR